MNRRPNRVTRVLLRLFTLAVGFLLATWAGAAWAGIPVPRQHPTVTSAQAAQPAATTQTSGVRVDVSPRATGQSRLAPAGTTNGSSTPLTNDTSQIQNPPHSPTPPGFPFGAPGGSYAPAGPSASGPTPGFRMTR